MKTLFLALMYLYTTSLMISIAGMEIVSGLMAISLILGLVFNKYFSQKNKVTLDQTELKFIKLGPDIALWAFWGSIALGAFIISVSPSHLRLEIIGEVRWILLLYVLTAVLLYLNKKQPQLLLWLAVAGALVSIFSIIQTQTGLDPFRKEIYQHSTYGGLKIWQAKGFFSNTMSYSYSIGVLLCFLISAITTKYFKNNKNKLLLGCTGLVGISFLLTFTRGAWLAGFVSIFTMLAFFNWRTALKTLAVTILLVSMIATVSEPVRERLSTIVKEKSGAKSVSQRWDLWRANWAMFKDHPVLGVGYAQNARYTQSYHNKLMGKDGFVSNAHNNYLQVLAGSGIVGFLFWIYFCGHFFIQAICLWHKERKTESWARTVALGSIGAQLYFHIGGLTQATFFDNEPLNIFILGWALLVSQKYISQSTLRGIVDQNSTESSVKNEH